MNINRLRSMGFQFKVDSECLKSRPGEDLEPRPAIQIIEIAVQIFDQRFQTVWIQGANA